MRRNILNYSDLIEHDYLWDEGNGLQPQAVAPHELPGGPPTVDDECDDQSGREEHLEMREIVTHGIISLYVAS